MNATDTNVLPELSRRVHPLSSGELRAALRAIHRILVVTRHLNRHGSNQAEMENILDSIENLPTMLLRPAEFEDLFEMTLADLAASFPMMRGIYEEFQATA